MILVSGCLVGLNCKYTGGNNLNPKIVQMVKEGKVIPFCPEQLGGASTPRTPCEIHNGTGEDVLKGKAKVMDKEKKDITEVFLKGAKESLKIAKLVNPKKIILKERSPSCGVNMIYDGSFTGKKIAGMGVTAALLFKNGFSLLTEEELEKSEH